MGGAYPERASQPSIYPGSVKALPEIRSAGLPYGALDGRPADAVLSQDSANLAHVDTQREVGGESFGAAVIAVDIQAVRDRVEHRTVLRHRPGEVEVIGADGVEASSMAPKERAFALRQHRRCLTGEPAPKCSSRTSDRLRCTELSGSPCSSTILREEWKKSTSGWL